MGFLPYSTYTSLINPSVEKISIVTLPFNISAARPTDAKHIPQCKTFTLDMQQFLQSQYPSAQVEIKNDERESLLTAFARIIFARQTICSPSTFCYFAVMGATGRAEIMESSINPFMKILVKTKPQKYRYIPSSSLLSGKLVQNMTDSEVANWLRAAKPAQTGEPTKVTVFDTRAVCESNPYQGALKESLHEIAGKMDVWLENIGDHHHKALTDSQYFQQDHARFFPFNADMTHCKEASISCMGGNCTADQSKIVCGLDELRKMKQDDEDCIVYSIGGNNQWAFENDILKNTPCEVHTFDCTGPVTRFKPPKNDRLHFHHICLGTQHQEAAKECPGTFVICGEVWTLAEMQKRLNHHRIDLFKMDIEGFEWSLFESWPELADASAGKVVLPYQILVEIHFGTQFPELRPYPVYAKNQYFRTPRDMVNLQAHFLRMGYAVAVRDDNEHCPHCTELTLLRTRCPDFK